MTRKQHAEEEAPQASEDLSKKIDELTNTLKYIQADYENYRKRVERDKQEFQTHAARGVIEDILPIIDTFDLCLKAAESNEKTKSFEMIYAQLIGLLESKGVKPIQSCGIFNPALHEPLLQETSEQPKGTILEELQKGYMLGDKVIRPARVKISKGKIE